MPFSILLDMLQENVVHLPIMTIQMCTSSCILQMMAETRVVRRSHCLPDATKSSVYHILKTMPAYCMKLPVDKTTHMRGQPLKPVFSIGEKKLPLVQFADLSAVSLRMQIRQKVSGSNEISGGKCCKNLMNWALYNSLGFDSGMC